MNRRITVHATFLMAIAPMVTTGSGVENPVPARAPEARECVPRPPEAGGDLPDWAILLDGRVIHLHSSLRGSAPALPDNLRYDEKARVEIVCSRRAAEMFGLRVRYGVVSAWTRDPLEGWRRILATVQNAQVRHSMAHGTAEDPSRISVDVRSPLTLRGRVEGDEWVAELSHPRVNTVCWVSSHPSLRPEGVTVLKMDPSFRVGEPRCDPRRTPDRAGD